MNFPGLSMGIFAGSLQFTVVSRHQLDSDGRAGEDRRAVRRATSSTPASKGFSTDVLSRVIWRDTSDERAAIPVRRRQERHASCRSRPGTACWLPKAKAGSLATFPPPHKFFWAREIHKNLGLRLVSQGRRQAVRHGRSTGGARRVNEDEERSTISRSTTRRRAPGSTWGCIST